MCVHIYLSISSSGFVCVCFYVRVNPDLIKSKLIRELLNHSCSAMFFPHFVGFYITLPHFDAVIVVVAAATDKFQHTHTHWKREFRHLFCKYVQRFAWQNFHNEMCSTTPFACESIHSCRCYKNSSFRLGKGVNALENVQKEKKKHRKEFQTKQNPTEERKIFTTENLISEIDAISWFNEDDAWLL